MGDTPPPIAPSGLPPAGDGGPGTPGCGWDRPDRPLGDADQPGCDGGARRTGPVVRRHDVARDRLPHQFVPDRDHRVDHRRRARIREDEHRPVGDHDGRHGLGPRRSVRDPVRRSRLPLLRLLLERRAPCDPWPADLQPPGRQRLRRPATDLDPGGQAMARSRAVSQSLRRRPPRSTDGPHWRSSCG